MSVRWAEVALLALLLAGHLEAEVTIRQASDKSVDVRAERYSARVDGQGNLVELVVVGAKSLTHQFGNPGKPPPEPPSVSVAGKAVVVQSGKGRAEWAFGEDAVHVVTEGYIFECRIDGSVKAVLAPGGRNGAFPHYAGGSTALVLCNDRMVAYSAMHVHENRFLPPGYTNGTKKPGDRIEFDLGLGALVDPVNHAPDVKCPIIFGYGADDDLSPPQGIEAMYHLAGSAWKRISRDAGGHQYSPGYQQLQKALDALLRE
jgi:hypothetical protein